MKSILPALLIFGAGCASTRVPDLLDPRGLPAPQAVSSVEVSENGRFITVTTLAFRHQPNVWVLSNDGKVLFGRAVAPWAPFQSAPLDSGRGFGVGLAYSRVTSPYPTISLFGDEKGEETVLEDSGGERGWLRYGEGDWRTGWLQSHLGDLLVRAGDSVVTVRGHNGAVRLTGDGAREKFPLKYGRPYRMSASADGRAIACGYIVPDASRPLVSVIDATSGNELWKAAAARGMPELPPLPAPDRDHPELSEQFNLSPDALVPFRMAASVAVSADGTSVAAADYGGWMWVRRGPYIGKWDPPYHAIPFVPRQRGYLRILDSGRESTLTQFPEDGLFEVRSDPTMKRVWAVPMSWFARGMAGAAWLPTDPGIRTVYRHDGAGEWKAVWSFPDAVSDIAISPDGDSAWAACWDGRLYFGRNISVDVGGTARIRWNREGTMAIAGTERGEVLGLDRSGKVLWRVPLPTVEPGPAETMKPVFEGIPVFAVGRTGKEHAYVGDTWLIKTESGGFLIDAGGTSSVPQTIRRIQAAGVDPGALRHLLHTHSHGDHSGGAYLWRSMGLKIVAPESASYALSWLMPMLSDYGVWVPRPVDVPLPLKRAGDETGITVAGQKIRAVFVPGHSTDSVLYLMELGGKRVVFTGDIGFQAPSDILHRCWSDVEKAAVVTKIVREKILPFRPDVVFTGHGGRPDGTAFLEDLVRRSEESIFKAKSK